MKTLLTPDQVRKRCDPRLIANSTSDQHDPSKIILGQERAAKALQFGLGIKAEGYKALHRSATVDAANIHVDVHGDKVSLTGKVRSWAEKKDAENAAWALPSVREVENKLVVDTTIMV